VRDGILGILRHAKPGKTRRKEILKKADQQLKQGISERHEVKAQATIVRHCLDAFMDELEDEIRQNEVEYLSSGDPVEFDYDAITFFVAPEVAYRLGDTLRIITFKTGKAEYLDEESLRLKAGGLSCWGKVVLEWEQEIEVVEGFLRDGCLEASRSFSDDDLDLFLSDVASVVAEFSASESPHDFPARPNWRACRFCPFVGICESAQ